MMRHALVVLAVVLASLAVAPPAFAGSYLDRAALLLDEARKEGDMLYPRTQDKELVDLVRQLADARAKAGRKMEVPAAIVKAHPHLLLVLENLSRAAEAASEGNFKKFVEHLMTARDEDRTFRALVTELGYALPEVGATKQR